MHKRMTISIDEAVYEGLVRVIGRREDRASFWRILHVRTS